jgi:hypothetical protein
MHPAIRRLLAAAAQVVDAIAGVILLSQSAKL